MNLSSCNGGKKPCPHLTADGSTLFCAAFREPLSEVRRCGPKLIKLALKRHKLNDKLKGKKK
jgi:hypothetical protein